MTELDDCADLISCNERHTAYLDKIRTFREIAIRDSIDMPESYLPKMNKHLDYFMLETERMEALALAGNTWLNLEQLTRQISESYLRHRLVSKQHIFNTLPVPQNGTFVNIGCGAFPDTLMYLSQHSTFEQLIGIDISNDIIFLADTLLQTFPQRIPVQLHCTDGAMFDFSEADVIFIPGFIHENEDIINQIKRSARRNTCLIVDHTKIFHYTHQMQKLLGHTHTYHFLLNYGTQIFSVTHI